MRVSLAALVGALAVVGCAAAFAADKGAPVPLRSIDPTETEAEAVPSLQRRAAELGAELERVGKELEKVKARARAIVEEARAHHGLADGERLWWDVKAGRWDVFAPLPSPSPSPLMMPLPPGTVPASESTLSSASCAVAAIGSSSVAAVDSHGSP